MTTIRPDTISSVVLHHFRSESGERHSLEHRQLTTLRAGALGQVWTRRVQVGPDWQPVDLGWLAGLPVSLLCIANTTRAAALGNPTPAQVAATADAALVSIAVTDGPAFAVAGYTGQAVWVPSPDTLYSLRANKRADVTITAYPG